MPALGDPIPAPPRAIIFDIGRVIVPIHLERATGALGARNGLSAAQVWKELETDPRWSDWQEGRMAPGEFHAYLCAKFHLALPFDEFCANWNRVLEPGTILPESLFERLARRARLALVSNTDPIHAAHIESHFEFIRHFPVRVYSCRVGASKPAPAIYLRALDGLGVSPKATLYIDDVKEYAAAASALGMSAFHFTAPADLLAEFSRLDLLAPRT